MKDLFGVEGPSVFIEIGNSFLKLAETRESGVKKVMVRLVKRPLVSKDENAISEEIRRLLDSLKTRPKSAYLNLPRHFVTIRFLKLPSVDEEEIKKILKIESLKHLPYTEEEIVYGHWTIERREDGYSDVLLAAAQASVVNSFLAILRKVQLGVDYISLGSEALFLWCKLALSDMAEEDVMVVNIDYDYIDIDVVKAGRLVFTRGALYDDSGQLGNRNIIDQVRLSIATYQKESGTPLSKIILTGASDRVKKCEELLKIVLKVPIEAIDQMKNIPIGKDSNLDLESASFVELLGISLRPNDVKVNLLPANVVEEVRLKSSKKTLAFTLTMAILIVITLFGLAIKRLHDKRAFLSYIESELNKMSPRVARAQKMIKAINIIKEESRKKTLAIDVLSEVYKLNPSTISLNMLDFERNRSLTIRGKASSLGEVLNYVNLLEASPYFNNVKVKYATKRVIENKEMADFEISCILSEGK